MFRYHFTKLINKELRWETNETQRKMEDMITTEMYNTQIDGLEDKDYGVMADTATELLKATIPVIERCISNPSVPLYKIFLSMYSNLKLLISTPKVRERLNPVVFVVNFSALTKLVDELDTSKIANKILEAKTTPANPSDPNA